MSEKVSDAKRLELTHRYRHPPEVVFDAWTDEEGMRGWMRPGSTIECECELDVREGGRYRINMITEERSIEHTGVYKVVDRPRRLVFTWNAPHLPEETVVTVTFEPVDGGTVLTLVHEGLPDEDSVKGHSEGWGRILETLGRVLAA